MKAIYRASFARFTVMRETIARTQITKGCDNCGQSHRQYAYHIANDGGRSNAISGHFCSASCCKSYHSLNRGWGEF